MPVRTPSTLPATLLRGGPVALAVALLALAGCSSYEPKAELEVSGTEAYWGIESKVGSTSYLAPVVRLTVRNKGRKVLRSVEASVRFERVGEEGKDWGSAFKQIASARQPLQPGESRVVALTSDGRYYSTGPAEAMLSHAQFKDARAAIYLRVGASPWTSFGHLEVERAVGARSVRETAAPAPGPAPEASPPPGR